MNRFEWIAVLKKAKELAKGKNELCHDMFSILLEAMQAAPLNYYREERTEEEEEGDEE